MRLSNPSSAVTFKSRTKALTRKFVEIYFFFFKKGGVLASASVDGVIILWDMSDGSKTNILSQENGEAIRSCLFRLLFVLNTHIFIIIIVLFFSSNFHSIHSSTINSPDGMNIVSSDDSGNVCVWNQSKSISRYSHTMPLKSMTFSSFRNKFCLTGKAVSFCPD